MMGLHDGNLVSELVEQIRVLVAGRGTLMFRPNLIDTEDERVRSIGLAVRERCTG